MTDEVPGDIRTYTAEQVADILQVNIQTVWKWDRQGRLHSIDLTAMDGDADGTRSVYSVYYAYFAAHGTAQENAGVPAERHHGPGGRAGRRPVQCGLEPGKECVYRD